jgi:molecular chaperone HtpG
MSQETYAFSADINQLLSLIINTFYSNKDVFLRELVSNASDALNKIRYESLTNTEALSFEQALEIRISFDKEYKRLIIRDTGIGMTKDDMIKNLGTIANSGTKRFIESLSAGADISMIGQFGVGFYSAYLVADKVTVISKHNNDVMYSWESNAGGSFSISEVSPSDYPDVNRGSMMILHLKDDMQNYLEEDTIRKLIKKHNEFIDFPIYLETIKTRTVDVEESAIVEEQNTDVEKTDEVVEDVDEEVEKKEEEKNEKQTKEESYVDWEYLNQEKPLWTRSPKEVTQEEYASFYKTISGDYEQHLNVSHFSVEGQIEFKGLLFVPKRAPFDLFDNGAKKPNNIKLYVRKVFITDNSEDIIPEYLKFIKGVIDSEDLPLNISRETLQQNKIMKVIKKNVMKKCLELFEKIAEDPEQFKTFYEQYSKNIKLGVHEDTANRQKLASFLRYESSKSSGDGNQTSLDEYIGRMNDEQKGIYYITGESKKAIMNSPFLEKFKKLDLEVLFLVDPLDEYITQQLKEYGNKKLICITKENLEMDTESDFEGLKEDYKKVCEYMKNILGESIDKVVVSNRLDSSPCVLVTNEYGWTANMQRIMKAQALRGPDMGYMMGKKIMEINPYNNIIKKIKERLDSEDKSESRTLNDLIYLLYDITVQSSGFTLDDPSSFSNRILKLINMGLGMDDAPGESNEEDKTKESVENNDSSESMMEEVD